MSHALAPMRPQRLPRKIVIDQPLVIARAPQDIPVDALAECVFCGSETPARHLSSSGAGVCCYLDADDC